MAPAQLLALSASVGLAAGLALSTAWRAIADTGPHLAALIAACAVATCVALRVHRGGLPARRDEDIALGTSTRLLAQMRHDLRTPLNAVIGFSEAMQHELHGPLGNAQYHEYAAHITESGGRLLKASEDAIAIAATMSRLVAGRRVLRRDRLPASALIEEARAALGTPARGVRLDVEGSTTVMEIDCDWQATSQALQHLLDEAISHTAPGGTVLAKGTHNDGARRIEIVAKPPGTGPTSPTAGVPTGGDGLRLTLIRSLLEMQGVHLRVSRGAQPGETWSARIVFPPRGWRRARPRWPSQREPGWPMPTRQAHVDVWAGYSPLVR